MKKLKLINFQRHYTAVSLQKLWTKSQSKKAIFPQKIQYHLLDARFLDEMRKLSYLYEKWEPSGNNVQKSNAKLEKMKEKQKQVAMAF